MSEAKVCNGKATYVLAYGMRSAPWLLVFRLGDRLLLSTMDKGKEAERKGHE